MKIHQTGKKMQADALHGEVGQRVAYALRQVYPAHAAKLIARDFGVDERTAKGWLAGQTPQGKHLLALMHKLGAWFASAVLVPVGDWASIVGARARLDLLQQEYDDLGRDLAALGERKAKWGDLADQAPGPVARVASAPQPPDHAEAHGPREPAAGPDRQIAPRRAGGAR